MAYCPGPCLIPFVSISDDLAIDYQFTFNLTKSDDKHFTAINFKNKPTKMDVDVDFSIASSVPAKVSWVDSCSCSWQPLIAWPSSFLQMNLTYRFTPANSKESKETVLHAQVNCSSFKERFSKDQYVFGSEENTTFYVYVYDFEPPLWIVISFSQHPKLDLLQFFITFSTYAITHPNDTIAHLPPHIKFFFFKQLFPRPAFGCCRLMEDKATLRSLPPTTETLRRDGANGEQAIRIHIC